MKCPFPACEGELSGRHSAFCAGHHFRVEPATARAIIKYKIELDRARSADVREHIEERIAFWTGKAIEAAVNDRLSRAASQRDRRS